MINITKRFKRLTKRPTKYLQVQDDIVDKVKLLVKDIYDYNRNTDSESLNKPVLPELFIQNFDEEQIWQQIELKNDVICKNSVENVSKLLAAKNRVFFPLCNKENYSEVNEQDVSECGSEEEINDIEHGSDSEKSDEEGKTRDKNQRKDHKIYKPTLVDDKFFKLRQLEEFLDREDKHETKSTKKSKDSDSDSDYFQSVDLFQDFPSDEEKEEETKLFYNEFFDAPEDENENEPTKINDKNVVEDKVRKKASLIESQEEDEDQNENIDRKKSVRFNLSPANSDDDNESDDGDEENTNDPKTAKSEFESRQERLQARIQKLEERALSEKPWQMKGEISATARPQNSLLEEILEYDMTSRPAPVITEQTTMKLEDIIRQRIKDKVWDDVERKVKPTLAPDEYKKTLVMDQEKSKLSLAEIYEQEYLKQKETLIPESEKTEEEPEEHRAIRGLMSALFSQLDALCNFHFTPKPIIPEVKIVSNLPAITMEEVAPVAVSDATLLAPEEVKRKEKGDLMSKAERTKTDKKRERRKKKLMQKHIQKDKEKREKIVDKLNPGLGNKYSKERANQELKKLSNEKNVHLLADEGKNKSVRSSTAFFNQLQNEVTSHIKKKAAEINGTGGPKAKKRKI